MGVRSLLKQPNKWSCLPTAFAIGIDLPIDQFLMEIGHDGSEILWPELEEPYCRRAFHVQECIEVCLKNGYAVTMIQKQPFIINRINNKRFNIDSKINVLDYRGILVGLFRNKPHAAYYSDGMIIDPNGITYMFNGSIIIESFFILNQIKNWP